VNLPLPRAAVLAAWLGSWLRGDSSADDLLAHVDAGHPPAVHVLTALPGSDSAVPLALALGSVRELGASGATTALPAPGDPVGLRGPTAFNTAAIDAGGAVLLEAAGLGLVPKAVGGAVEWRCHPCAQPPWLDAGEEGRHLRQSLLDVTAELVALDVASWQPDIPDAVLNVRHRAPAPLPPSVSARDRETVDRALLCRDVVALARATPAGALSAADIRRRDAAIDVLDRAARRAIVAVCR